MIIHYQFAGIWKKKLFVTVSTQIVNKKVKITKNLVVLSENACLFGAYLQKDHIKPYVFTTKR